MVFAVHQLQERCREQNKELHLAFVDLTKAFDTMNWNGLWKILQKSGCPSKLTALMASFHDGMQARVLENGDVSDTLQVSKRVKQGCLLAPTLFSILFAAMLLDASSDCDRGMYIQFCSCKNAKPRPKSSRPPYGSSSSQTTVHWVHTLTK